MKTPWWVRILLPVYMLKSHTWTSRYMKLDLTWLTPLGQADRIKDAFLTISLVICLQKNFLQSKVKFVMSIFMCANQLALQFSSTVLSVFIWITITATTWKFFSEIIPFRALKNVFSEQFYLLYHHTDNKKMLLGYCLLSFTQKCFLKQAKLLLLVQSYKAFKAFKRCKGTKPLKGHLNCNFWDKIN